ncbi:hypothetical protein DFH09DRAFT_1086877 [Mycena vulgaris]|nr:hypothetical protein DFH09DRAFT_1086877 [Mycena vulgaris]
MSYAGMISRLCIGFEVREDHSTSRMGAGPRTVDAGYSVGSGDLELIGSGDMKDHTESKAGETNSDLNIIPRETRPRPTETSHPSKHRASSTPPTPMLEELSRGAAAGSWGWLLRMEKTWEMYECSEMTTGQETPQMVPPGSKEQHTGKFG